MKTYLRIGEHGMKILALFLLFQLYAFASNIVAVQSISVKNLDTAKVIVSMLNDSSVNGMNFIMDFNPIYIKVIDVKPIGRSQGMRGASANVFNSSRISFLLYDRAGASLQPDSGDIFEMTFVAESLQSQIAITHFTFNEGIAADSDRNLITFNYVGNSITITDVKEVGSLGDLPKEYALFQNFPNPFNPTTTIHFNVPRQSFVTLMIYNILGQSVTTLFDGIQDPGYKSVGWNASSVSSGIYFYRLEAVGVSDRNAIFSQVKKMILLK